MVKRVRQWVRTWLQLQNNTLTPVIIERAKHAISRALISPNALKVLYRLRDSGASAYLVGGGVRDILLGRKPKDFDVVTDAHPEAIHALFRNSRIIGRRFRLVHVFYKDEVIEVSTFRANTLEKTREPDKHIEMSMIQRDNTYGTIEEDAWRRDFTVNALYYNIADFSVEDYMQGMQDLKHRVIRVIGDPVQRYHEDPVRMLRAIRLAAKLDFEIEEQAEKTLLSLPHLLQHVPASRLYDEVLKLFFEGNAEATYYRLLDYQYMDVLFPQTMHVLHVNKNNEKDKLIVLAMSATDMRLKQGKTVNPGFLLAVLLWPVLQSELSKMQDRKKKFYFKLYRLIDEVIKTQTETVMIPKRLQLAIKSIWVLQFHLEMRREKRIFHLLKQRYFRAAFDFMGLRVDAGKMPPKIFEWWKRCQKASCAKQMKMIKALHESR